MHERFQKTKLKLSCGTFFCALSDFLASIFADILLLLIVVCLCVLGVGVTAHRQRRLALRRTQRALRGHDSNVAASFTLNESRVDGQRALICPLIPCASLLLFPPRLSCYPKAQHSLIHSFICSSHKTHKTSKTHTHTRARARVASSRQARGGGKIKGGGFFFYFFCRLRVFTGPSSPSNSFT